MIGFSPEVEKRIAHFKQDDERRTWRGLILAVIFLVVVIITAISLPFRPVVSICWAVTVLGLSSWLSVLASKVGNGERNNELYDELLLRSVFLGQVMVDEELTKCAELCHRVAQRQQDLQRQLVEASPENVELISSQLEDITDSFKKVHQHFFTLRGLLEKRGYRVKKGEGKADSYKLYLSLNPSTPPPASASSEPTDDDIPF